MRPVGINDEQLKEAYTIDDMPEGREKKKAKRAWERRYKIRWPRVLFRGNPEPRDHCEKRSPCNSILTNPGRFLIDSLS
jgi:hypothetical protein